MSVKCLISLGVVVMVGRATQRLEPLLDTRRGNNAINAQHGSVSTIIQQIWDLTPQVWTCCIAMYFLLISSWRTTGSVDQTAFVISSGISISRIPFLFWVPFFAWPFSISISTSLFLYPSPIPSLSPSLSFFNRLNFSMPNICSILCVVNLWVQRCLGSIMFQTQVRGSWYLELFYAKSKGLSVIEFVNVKDFWDLCKIMHFYLHQILSLRFLHLSLIV